MKATDKIDAARIDLLLSELRLPGIKLIWAALATTADKEGWAAARFLAALAEQEMVERNRRRFERHLEEARLPPGKTLDTFDFTAVPMISKAQVQALAAGDAWLEKGANLLCFGPPGAGKSHLAAALGLALIEKGWRVLFTRTTDLVQKLQIARRDLALEAAIAKLDKYTRGLERADGGHAHQAAPHPYSDPGDRLRPRRHGQRGRVADPLDRRPAQRDPRAAGEDRTRSDGPGAERRRGGTQARKSVVRP